jgi:hypothetical protein
LKQLLRARDKLRPNFPEHFDGYPNASIPIEKLEEIPSRPMELAKHGE